jgi:hypothetical protein
MKRITAYVAKLEKTGAYMDNNSIEEIDDEWLDEGWDEDIEAELE